MRQENESLNRYLQEINKFPFLSPEEEVAVAQQSKEGDPNESRDKLVQANLRFVVSVAKKYQGLGISLPDLINEGNIGLITAAERFDETRGFKFISYAVWWIRNSILRALSENGRTIRLPESTLGRLSKVKKEIEAFRQTNGREPSFDEILDVGATVDMTTGDIEDVLRDSQHISSLDNTFGEENERTLGDILPGESISPEDTISHTELMRDIEFALNDIPPEEAEVLKYSFGLCGYDRLSREQIAEKLGMKSEKVRQLKGMGLRRLKQNEVLRGHKV
ncbi:RNA polymerase sigma factor RpoD/SigA [Candidatus Gracilibacteria bacterium]|nr:RNA polymerase sigma factor RpoD/SigA [Candidatus Gracilibacteria bacterium]